MKCPKYQGTFRKCTETAHHERARYACICTNIVHFSFLRHPFLLFLSIFLIASNVAIVLLCKRFLRFGFIRVLSVQSPALCMRFYMHSQEFFPLKASSRFSSLFDAHRGFHPVRAHAHFCGKAIGHSVFDQPCNRVGLDSKLSGKAIVFRKFFRNPDL